MKTTSRWIKEQQFESLQNGQQIRLDGEAKNGFSPKAALLSGLAACSGIDLVDILKKMRIKFEHLEIETEAEQTTEHPRVFKDIHIRYRLKADKSDEEQIRKAIDLSLDKYCGVAAMLKKNSSIIYELIFE